jgi:EpsI family protein
MRRELNTALLLATYLVAAAILSTLLKPKRWLANPSVKVNLEAIVPTRFGDWQALAAAGSTSIVNPVVDQELRAIYSETLTRTYTNGKGYHLMLSLAYGGDQSRELQVHRPEVCYVAQGFQVSELRKVIIENDPTAIPAMQMLSSAGTRSEPVTYWVRIGDKVVRGNIEQGLARLNYGLRGYIADGLVFRVSSIDADPRQAYLIQAAFVQSLMANTAPAHRRQLIGGLAR